MKTAIRWLALLVLASLIAAACSGDDDDSTGDADSATQEAAVDAADEPDADPDDGETETADVAPEPDAEVVASRYRATIRRTTGNVPHVIADDLPSLGFGYGYALAEDHTCSLADGVLQGRSEAASWFGERYLAQDSVLAALGHYDLARAQFDALDVETQELIIGYAAGYNEHLATVGADGINGYCQGADWLVPIDEYDLAAYYLKLTYLASLDQFYDLIFAAQPPSTEGADESAAAFATDFGNLGAASNAWAIGPDRSASGNAMLVGNPHFPWEGALRVHEAHLTVPGELNVYGGTLIGLPVMTIGFNDDVAWSQTVSIGSRFTAYTLSLAEGDPTSYRYDDETRQLEPREVTVEVLDPTTGELSKETNTIWFSHYGPVLSFPGIGWTDTTVITMRDANAGNSAIVDHFLDMNRADSMDAVIAAHADNQAVPWVNTLAASREGRIWYTDASQTPNLSPEAIATWSERAETDFLTQTALGLGIVLLDGSDSLFEWQDSPDARAPGLVPFEAMPQLERTDFLYNANDSYWIVNPDEPIVGVSPLHGLTDIVQSTRSRMNATQLAVGEVGEAGADDVFDYDELVDAVFVNRVFTAEVLLDDVIVWCGSADARFAEACSVLAAWDRRADLDSVGAHLWREFIEFAGEGIWANPFDPADPIGTPSGLVGPGADGSDLVADALDHAIDVLDRGGVPLDAALGDIQFAQRGEVRVPIHGGRTNEGIANVNQEALLPPTTSEALIDRGVAVEGAAGLTDQGYSVTFGASYLQAVELTPDGPIAQTLLTYGNTGDTTAEAFVEETERFSRKEWKVAAFDEAAIIADPAFEEYEVTGG